MLHKSGGYERVCRLTGISQSQLSRYANGRSEIPAKRLLLLADVLKVSVDWLLTGNNDAFGLESVCRSTQEHVERLIRILQRYTVERAFLPAEIGRVAQIMVASQAFASSRGILMPYLDYDIENGLTYLNGIRKHDWLDVFVEGCILAGSKGMLDVDAVWANTWTSIIQHAFRSHFGTSMMATDYFDRLDIPIHASHLKMMQEWVQRLVEAFGTKQKISVLDAGCGNGRHLLYLHNLGDQFSLHGCDTAAHALKLCHDKSIEGRLPKNAVKQGDFFDLPYPDDSFDAVMHIANLQFVPLIPGSTSLGVGRALVEMARVLKKSGLGLILIRSQAVDEYFPVFQLSHDPGAVEGLLRKVGLRTVSRTPMRMDNIPKQGARVGRGLSNQDIWIVQRV